MLLKKISMLFSNGMDILMCVAFQLHKNAIDLIMS